MAADWRLLFDSVGTHWTTRTGNSIRGAPCINCPFCDGDDPSTHLNVFPDGRYFCMRNRDHQGRNPIRLLRKLLPNRSREECVKLLNEFWTDAPIVERERPIKSQDQVTTMWESFKSAADNPLYLKYLANRGFTDPDALCRRYDLRYSLDREWVGRILFPLKEDGDVVSWTGRAISPFAKLRYKLQSVTATDLIYVPRDIRANVMLVEGPFDALKIAAATEKMAWSSVALLSAAFSPDRMWHVIEVIAGARNVYTSLDPDVSPVYPTATMHTPVSMTVGPYRELNFWLASVLKTANIARFRLPNGHEDWGAMHIPDIVDVLSNPQRGNENGQITSLLTYREATQGR